MDSHNEKILRDALEAAFGSQSAFPHSERALGESQIFAFLAQADAQVAGKTIPLDLFRLKTASTASFRDAALLVPSMRDPNRLPVLLAPPLTEKKQALLRSMGLFFIDDAGNAWLSESGVHVDIRGRKAPSGKASSPASENAFSDKATLVLRILLEYGPLGIRDLSRLAAKMGFPLSPGYVSKTASALITQGYAAKQAGGTIALRRKQDILDDWVQAYAKLNPSERGGFFLPAAEMDEVVRRASQAVGDSAVLSERAGASLVDPFATFDSVLLLARNFGQARQALIDSGASEVERGANIELVIPRYRVSSFYGTRIVEGCEVASDLQLYLDLTRQPKRGLEAAEHLFSRTLASQFSEEEGGEV
ncbi:hypothetical protein [Arabiibacter massiliensis]|uniref:hypothetical protein n=1 Tax=Arabiibacter massiliensis TaxID=1870985 RepID=UPI0009BACDAB|nr:hypothetical protein [Arabiibacter massiliensis]